MSIAKLTLIGFSNYDEHFFDGLTFPDGINKDDVVMNILLRGGEFEVLFANPEFMKGTFPMWSRKWAPTFEKWLAGIQAEYNPIENYDRHEYWKDTNNGSTTATDTTTATGGGTTTTDKAAYDSETYSHVDQVGQSTSSSSSSNAGSTASNTFEHSADIHGNIGVTTAAQMLEGHYAIAAWNLVEHITDIFLREYVIPVY